MNLSHLQYFKKLAEVKHYTKAAQELFIAQPTLSVAISQIEKELGVPLFKKNQRVTELTEYGQDFYEYVCTALNALNKGIEVVQEKAGRINGTLNIGTVYAMQGKYWSKAISDFRDSINTNVQINFKQGFTANLLAQLKDGSLDVAFAGKLGDDPAIHSVPCWSQELAVGVHKDHPLASRRVISLDELEPYHILSYHSDSPVSEELASLIKGRNLDVDLSYNDEITLCSLVTADPDSVALFAYSFLAKSFESIVLLSIREAPIDFHQVYLSYRVDEDRLHVVDNFIDFIIHYQFPPALIGSS